MSTATINSVLLSHHNSIINCLSPASSIHSETITIAGNKVLSSVETVMASLERHCVFL